MMIKKTEKTKHDVWFIYDGQCPICQMGASLYKIRQSVGQLHIVDARTQPKHPAICEVNSAYLDLDEGMVIKYRGELYHGNGALQIMAELGSEAGWFNKANRLLFQYRFLSRALYPFMRAARNSALFLKGIGKIRNLES